MQGSRLMTLPRMAGATPAPTAPLQENVVVDHPISSQIPLPFSGLKTAALVCLFINSPFSYYLSSSSSWWFSALSFVKDLGTRKKENQSNWTPLGLHPPILVGRLQTVATTRHLFWLYKQQAINGSYSTLGRDFPIVFSFPHCPSTSPDLFKHHGAYSVTDLV